MVRKASHARMKPYRAKGVGFRVMKQCTVLGLGLKVKGT